MLERGFVGKRLAIPVAALVRQVNVQDGSATLGSVRGALSNGRPYRDRRNEETTTPQPVSPEIGANLQAARLSGTPKSAECLLTIIIGRTAAAAVAGLSAADLQGIGSGAIVIRPF